ncbi:MAG TPA: hypothetical protein PLC26_06165 [Bacillota bacterium]|nr:hypothetical protein [Bacillota bacterium]
MVQLKANSHDEAKGKVDKQQETAADAGLAYAADPSEEATDKTYFEKYLEYLDQRFIHLEEMQAALKEDLRQILAYFDVRFNPADSGFGRIDKQLAGSKTTWLIWTASCLMLLTILLKRIGSLVMQITAWTIWINALIT